MAHTRSTALLQLPATIRSFAPTCLQCQTRRLHRLNVPNMRIPKPTPFVPDVQTFLTLIGRGLSVHASRIPSWEALFTLSSEQLRESGVEPARARRYLLWWRDRFRNGVAGIGSDLKHVKDGVAELRIVEVPSSRPRDQMGTLTKDPGMQKIITNVPPSRATLQPAAEADEDDTATATAPPRRLSSAEEANPVANTKISHGISIRGRGVEFVKGHQGVARLKVQEGLWEQRRGHKVDGGERRKAEVRAKRRLAERKKAR